jgi:hypothetical protein
MDSPVIERVERVLENTDRVRFKVWLSDDCEPEPFIAQMTRTEQVSGGFGEDGPSEAWVREHLPRFFAGRIANDEPVMPQVRALPSPFVLRADPV